MHLKCPLTNINEQYNTVHVYSNLPISLVRPVSLYGELFVSKINCDPSESTRSEIYRVDPWASPKNVLKQS